MVWAMAKGRKEEERKKKKKKKKRTENKTIGEECEEK